MSGRAVWRAMFGALVYATCVCCNVTPLHAQPSPRFPDAWVGRWLGRLTTFVPPDSVRNTIPISLEIARDASGGGYMWKTIFNADTVRAKR